MGGDTTISGTAGSLTIFHQMPKSTRGHEIRENINFYVAVCKLKIRIRKTPFFEKPQNLLQDYRNASNKRTGAY